ncbi:MAG: hypothetical protein DMF93_24235, partial [Acidobacteria bacterium]
LNTAINDGVAAGLGIGQAVTGFFAAKEPQFARHSILAAAARLKIPVTVHVAIGTDIIHMHPAASGAALGDGSLRDCGGAALQLLDRRRVVLAEDSHRRMPGAEERFTECTASQASSGPRELVITICIFRVVRRLRVLRAQIS